MGIRDKVAIVGMGCSKFGERWEVDDQGLAVEAYSEALEDAGIEPKDIKAAWYGTQVSGFSGARLALALKTDYIPITRIENYCATGIDTVRNACLAVASGSYDIVLALGVEKLKDTGFAGAMRPSLEPEANARVWHRISTPCFFAFYATKYFHTYGLSYEEGKRTLAKIAVKNQHNGTLSPKAHIRREVTIEQVMNAPMIVWPFGLYDCCGVSDGSAAAIITTPEIARTLRDDYILIKGLGISTGARQTLLRSDLDLDFVHWEETVRASRQAYEEAGIKNPRKEISIAQVHDCFTITELITYEDLGFSPRGRAKEDVDAGTFTMDGELPVQTDGGLKSFGHPIGATGLRQMYEGYKQLQGKAGPRQRKNVKYALNMNLGGSVGSSAIGVAILGNRD